MGLDLNDQLISETFDGLIKTINGDILTDTPTALTDGRGNNSSLKLATENNGVVITGSLFVGATNVMSTISTIQSDITSIEGVTDLISVTGSVNLDLINTKVGYITITQAVDLDTMESDLSAATTKLAGIESGAEVNPTASEIKTAYESNTNTNAFTDAEKTKLSGIETGAEVNLVDSVNSQTGAVVLDADDIDDTSTTNKFTTAADISKLSGIQAGAEVNVVDSVNTYTGDVVLDADDIDDTSTVNKFTTSSDISKLAGIEAGAEVNPTASEIKTSYESNSDTNAFTDSEKSKLAGISAGAEVNAVDSVNSQTGAVVLDADDIDDSATTNKFTTSADISKLAGIESGADVTDATNVAAAGALMDGTAVISDLADVDTTTPTDGQVLTYDTTNGWQPETPNVGDITSVTAGTGLSGGGDTGGVTLNLADTSVTAGSYTSANITIDAQGRITTASNGAGGVVSVNSQTGTVVLDADDISDTSTTNKFTTAAEITKLAGIETGADVTDSANVTTALASISVTAHSDVTSVGSGAIITSAERTKIGHISVTQAVDLDTMESDISDLNSDKYDKTGGTISGDVTITGNLDVNGTTTTIDTQTLSVEDPLIEMANANTTNSVDSGFYANYSLDAGTTIKYAGLFKDASDSDKFKLFKGLEVEPTTTVDTSGTGYDKGDLVIGDLNADNVTATITSTSTLANGVTASTQSTGDNSTKVATTAYVDASIPSVPVDSVNGQTGTVVLDADDISDTTTTNKFTTASEISKLAGIEAGADVTDSSNVTTALGSISVTAHSDVSSAGSGSIITSAERTKLSGIATGAEVNVNADWNAISGDAQILNKPTIPSAANNATITLSAGTGLSGGGNFTTDQSSNETISLAVDLSELTDMTSAMVGTDEFIVLDAGADRRKAASEIGLSIFNNDAGFTTNVGDITGVTAGTGLSGGGTSGSVTLSLATAGAGAGTYGSTADGTKIDTITLDAYGRVTAVSTGAVGDITGVTAGVGLSGGGTSGTVTLTLDMSELTDMTAAMVGTDEFIVLDAGADRRKAASEIGLSIFNNDAGFTTNTGDITGVTAGTGLSGGGSSGSVTLNVDLSELTDMTAAMVGSDEFIVLDAGADRRKAASEIGLSIFNNDASFVTSSTTSLSNYLRKNTNDTFTGGLTINGDIRGAGQQLVLNAGESYSVATGQTAENVYINAEGGLQVNSSPDNWSSGWAGRNTTTINNASGNSSFSGNVTVNGNMYVNEYIYHNGDTNTYLRFLGDYAALIAGGRNVIQLDEGTDPDKIQIGDSATYTYTNGRLGVGTSSPAHPLDVSGLGQFAGAVRITETGTAQYLLIGNQDSGGVDKPAMVRGVNGYISLGYGNSWSGEGGTFTSQVTLGAGTVDFNSNDLTGVDQIYLANNIVHAGDTNTYLQFNAADTWRVVVGGSQKVVVNSSGLTVSNGNVYAPVYYDSDDTSYYLNAGGTSNLKKITSTSSTFSSVYDISLPNASTGLILTKTGTAAVNGLSFKYNTSFVGSIAINNSSTSYNTTSDYRLKENLTPITDGIERLKLLKPKRFNFIGEEDIVDGFVAHEAQEVVPEAVTGEKDELDHEENPKYQGIDQSKLVPLLTAALQEAIAKIDNLESRLENLESQINS